MICCSRFETKGPLRPFFYLLTPLPVKIRREMGKNSELILRAIVYAAAAVFRLSICCSPFGNRSASKANGVENRFQISHYWPCVKIRGGKNYTEEITASEQLSELLSHDWDEYMHYVQCKASCGGIHQSNVGVNQLYSEGNDRFMGGFHGSDRTRQSIIFAHAVDLHARCACRQHVLQFVLDDAQETPQYDACPSQVLLHSEP